MESGVQVLAEARLEYERQRSLDRQLLDEEKRDRIMALASDFPRIWNDPKFPARERKRMVALMIEDVTLTRGTEITMHVRFKGGLTRTLIVPLALNAWKKYMTAPAVLAEIDRLLNEHTDAEVATVLNGRGLASGRRMKFTGQIIGALRKGNHLKSRYERLRERGMLDVLEMAALLGTSCEPSTYGTGKGDFAHIAITTREPISTRLLKQALRYFTRTANIAEARTPAHLYTQPTTRCSMKRSPGVSTAARPAWL